VHAEKHQISPPLQHRVVFASGYRVWLGRVPYLEPLIGDIELADGFPALDEGLGASISGLCLTGFPATRDFGPFFGFVKAAPTSASSSFATCSHATERASDDAAVVDLTGLGVLSKLSNGELDKLAELLERTHGDHRLDRMGAHERVWYETLCRKAGNVNPVVGPSLNTDGRTSLCAGKR
jgi:hypothetical protein